MRSVLLVLAALLSTSSVLPAMETPLLATGRNNRISSVDPGLGTATILEATTSKLATIGGVNWRNELEALARTPADQTASGEIISALRTGAPGCQPTVSDFISQLPAQAAEGQPSRQLVLEAEQAFWTKAPTYDGKVASAFDGQWLWLVVPSHRTVLVYEYTGNDQQPLVLKSWFNYGPMLYLLGAWRSRPAPAEIIRNLRLSTEQQEQLLANVTRGEDGTPPQPKGSEAWIAAVGGSAVLVDTANQKLLGFSMSGSTLKITSVRNLGIDLLIPSFRAVPTDQDLMTAYTRNRAAGLRDLGIQLMDPPMIRAICEKALVGDRATKASSLEAIIAGNQLVLDFKGSRKLMTYELRGDSGIDLTAVRDYSASLATTALDRMFGEQQRARQLLKQGEQAAARKQEPLAARLLGVALESDPTAAYALDTPTWRNVLKRVPGTDQVVAAAATKAQDKAKDWQAVLDLAQQYRQK